MRRFELRMSAVLLGLLGSLPHTGHADLACGDVLAWRHASTTIRSAEPLPASPPQPAHCKVVGTIDGTITFQAELPEAWNGKFMMGGGGGFAGRLESLLLSGRGLSGPTALQRGYATAMTDTGHQGAGSDGSWALRNPEARENFAHRAIHRTAEVAKALIGAYYSDSIDRSYFMGCSRGGGQAMIEAQRYPADFDGIVAGAPPIHSAGSAAARIMKLQAVFPNPNDLGTPLITAANRALLAKSILATCDTLDGVQDGILDDPRTCPFEPSDLPQCTSASPACLTKEQLAAIEVLYSGTVIDGRQRYPGLPFGSEAIRGGWDGWLTRVEDTASTPLPAGAPNSNFMFGTHFFKYFVYDDPSWDYSTYDFRDYDRAIAPIAKLMDATDPDLRAFRDRGGKLLLYHGWADAGLSALSTVDYYEAVGRLDATARDHARLFMLPGVSHCTDGPGPDLVDWITALEQWVEHGRAPASVLATKRDSTGATTRQRPVCAYPEVARYDGAGDPNQPESYSCGAAE